MNTLRLCTPALTFCGALGLLACGNEIGTTNTGSNNNSSQADAGSSAATDAGGGASADAGSPADSGSVNPACDDVSGTWTPTGLNTCVAPGDACQLTQNGCAVDLDCDNGAFSVSGSASGGHLELTNGANRCTADVVGDQMSANCSGPDILNNSCQGDFTRGTGGGTPEAIDGDADCDNSDQCELQCSVGGGCGHTCSDSAQCDSTCVSGGCRVSCNDGANCDSTCSGGGCTMTCSGAADCDFTCSGGGCTFVCSTTGSCDTTCTGGGCIGG